MQRHTRTGAHACAPVDSALRALHLYRMLVCRTLLLVRVHVCCPCYAEVCLPPAYVPNATLGTWTRPTELPAGKQITYSTNTTIVLLHPNCTGIGFDMPYEEQCIKSSGGTFVDVGVYCYSLDPFGNQVKTGYVSHLLDSVNRVGYAVTVIALCCLLGCIWQPTLLVPCA